MMILAKGLRVFDSCCVTRQRSASVVDVGMLIGLMMTTKTPVADNNIILK